MARALADARAAGRALLDLTVSNPTVVGLPYETERITRALADARSLEYEPLPFGLPAARQAVSVELLADGIELPPERVVLTASTSEAYGFAFQLLCDPGDSVLVPAPSYPLLEHLAALAGVRLLPYPLAYDGAWHVDTDALRRARASDTRALFVVTPNNPTGSYLKRDELDVLGELGLPIVSDEVFARYPLCEDARRVRSALQRTDALVLALGGLSKLALLPQVKLGWMLVGGPANLAEEALARLEIIADSYLSVGTPVQHALPELLAATRSTVQALGARVRENLGRLRALLAPTAASVLHVEGGWYAVLRLPRTKTEESWATELVAERGVVTQPGFFFDFPDEPYLVLSLLAPAHDLEEGVRRIAEHVR